MRYLEEFVPYVFFFLLPVIIFGFSITADVILRTTPSSFTERFKEMCLNHYWLYDLLFNGRTFPKLFL